MSLFMFYLNTPNISQYLSIRSENVIKTNQKICKRDNPATIVIGSPISGRGERTSEKYPYLCDKA